LARPDVAPARVAGHVVDRVEGDPAKAGDREVIDASKLGVALRAPLLPGELEVADQFLLIGIHRDERLSGPQGDPHLAVDVLEQGVAVR
jgi:hypothetical protein